MTTPDPFVLIAESRAYFRLVDLIRLQDLVKELQGTTNPGVKENTPQVLSK
jgi:hypothetical protein